MAAKKTTNKRSRTPREIMEIDEELAEQMGMKMIDKVDPITTDFGREDLNLMRDTINDIIKVLFGTLTPLK